MDELPFPIPTNLPFVTSNLENLDPSLVQGVLVGFFVFLIVLVLGFSRHYIASSSMQGLWAGLIIGMILLGAIEAGVYFGMRNFVFGENSNFLPENFKIALGRGTANLTQVLGIETQRSRPTAQTVVGDFQVLLPLDAELVKGAICKKEDKSD